MRKVISGGQTGVDQAALRAAMACGLEIGGWCPPGRVCEDGMIPADFPLKETELDRSPDAPDVPRSQRTEWNVRDSDATLVVRRGSRRASPAIRDRGTDWARRCAERYGRPLLECDVDDPDGKEKIQNWVSALGIETLSVGGPSESAAPGIGAETYALLKRVFGDQS
jgi:hypothetical protein